MSRWVNDAVDRVRGLLSDEQLALYEDKFIDPAAFTEAMRAATGRLAAYLEQRGERISSPDWSLVAAATLTTGNTGSGVYTEPRAAADRLIELRARRDKHPELGLGLLIRANDMPDAVIDRLGAASAAMAVVRARDTPVAPSLLMMVACAVADPAVAAETTADTVITLVDGALAEAARHRAMVPDKELRTGLSGPGNYDLVIQVAALRSAVDRHLGRAPAGLSGLMDELVKGMRGHVQFSLRHGQEADLSPALAMFALAKFMGGGTDGKNVESIYRALEPAVNGLDARWTPRPELALNEGFVPPTDLPGEIEHFVSWAMAELFADADRATCVHLRQWIVDREPGGDIVVLLDRLRRLDARFRAPLPDAAPEYGQPAGTDLDHDVTSVRRVLTERITRLVRDGMSRDAVASAVLPPLWSARGATVVKVGRRLLAESARRTGTTPLHTKLAAAVVVRAPFQFFRNAGTQGRHGPCACGARAYSGKAKSPVDVAQVCPHRTWEEPGFVEDYATLAQLGETISPDAVRRALGRYTGPFAGWVRDGCGC